MKQAIIRGGRAGQLLPHLYSEIRKHHDAGEQVLLLVPEQFTLQAERDLLRALQVPGLLRVRVLSPKRLRRLIHETGGRSPLPALDSVGSGMAISRALQLCGEELSFYKRAADRPGLPPKLSELIGELADAGLNPTALAQATQAAESEATRAKLRDLSCIWQRYLDVITDRFADETAQQQDALKRLEQSGVVQGNHVFVYGFDRLSRAFCALLTELARLAESCTVLLTMSDKDDRDARIFTLQRNCAFRLARTMEEAGIRAAQDQLPEQPQKERHEMLRFLERNLFARPRPTWDGAPGDALTLYACANPTIENAFAAQTLLNWHRSGIPWDRMAVACAGEPPASLPVALQQAGIPCEPDNKQRVLRHGLCRMLIGSLRAIAEGWRTPDLLTAASSGFSALSEAEAFRLENYVIANGIDRGKWLKPFTRGEKEEAEAIEPLRQKLIEPIEALHDVLLKARTGEAEVEALWRFLENIGAYDRLVALENRLIDAREETEAARTRQIWKVLLELLDQLRTLLGTPRCSLKDLCRYVEAGLNGRTLAVLPAVCGTVSIGQAGHMLTGELDALLFYGAQENALSGEKQTLITERERETLTACAGHTVGTLQQEESALRSYRIYCTLTQPLRYLTVSWSQASLQGEAAAPAAFIDDLRAIFADVKPGGGATAAPTPDAPIPTLEALAAHLRAYRDGHEELPDASWQEAAGWLWHDQRFGSLTQQISQNLHAAILPVKLSREQALKLFGDRSVSISRLEKYAGCPYRHFIEYGLKPVERGDFTFEADDRGNFYHDVMQQLTLQTQDLDWSAAELAQIDSLVDGIIEKACVQWAEGPLGEDMLGKLTGEQYKRVIHHAARLYARQQQRPGFHAYGAEVTFGYDDSKLPALTLLLPNEDRQPGQLDEPYKLALQGKIDRIDICERDGETRVRVIDYKSGTRTVDAKEVQAGLQLQLLLYLKAAAQKFANGVPAAAFYFPLRDPMPKTDEMTAEAAGKAREAAVKLDAEGWHLNDPDILDDLGISPRAKSHAMSRARMTEVLDIAEQAAVRTAVDLRSGKADIDPVGSACDYCRFAHICRHDPLITGGKKRELPEVKNSDFVKDSE